MNPGNPAAAVRWPDVPACYGWLSLDRRGNWRLKGDLVRHSGLVAFINRHYGTDGKGNWIFQNGPQAVFVALDYTPLIFRFEFDGRLLDHTGSEAGAAGAVWLDDEGNVLLQTPAGVGLLDDRDLGGFIDACRTGDGKSLDDCGRAGLLPDQMQVCWRGLLLQSIPRHQVADRFGFNAVPGPGG
jgi:hypothetical protein